jgi:hypothetical protein
VRRPPAAIDLEIIALDGSAGPGPTGRPGRRRHWPAAFVVAVLVVVGLAIPGRIQVAAAELHRLDRTWMQFSADEIGHQGAIASVWNAALPADAVLVNQAILRLDQEESERLAVLNRRLAGGMLVDRDLGRLRTAVRELIQLRAAVLQNAELIRMRSASGPATAVETWYPPVPALALVIRLLSAERGRFGVTEAAVGPRVQPYNSANEVLAFMSSDQREARSAWASLLLSRPRRSRFKFVPT